MNTDKSIRMLACWKDQRRPVLIKIDDDISTIEKTIINVFELQQVNNFYEYQIQYYDHDYERFVDLYSETLHLFQQNLYKLLALEAPQKSSKQWTLKVVSKTIETIRHRLGESITDDTYSYQQENDRTELTVNENNVSIKHHIEPSSLSGIHNPETLPRSQTSQYNNNDQLLRSYTSNGELPIIHNHPYGFGFDSYLAKYQRLQFESDMFRKSSARPIIGGVLLRASSKPDVTTTNDTLYPTVHFRIPNDQLHHSWFIYIYILTEADANSIHYLHASKGIFDNITKPEDKFGIILTTELVNPYVVQLSQSELRDGKFELRIKVCNVRNLSILKHEYLRKFPQLHTLLIHDDEKLLSKQTTFNLNFSNEKYHLGCILVQNNVAQDLCISNSTNTDNHRKRNDTDQSRQQDDELLAKKQKQE
ncbi:unnamed protein product [Rotaria sp. Silwood1]|nr:unnamed protein product [Rotaria sp. Silwood1]